MQKKKFIPIFILLLGLSGCGGQKKTIVYENPENMQTVDMSIDKSGINFFDEDVETFVLDDEAPNKDGSDPLTLAWQESTQNTMSNSMTVYFDYDSCNPRSDQKKQVKIVQDQVSDWLKQGLQVVFKGHSCKWHGDSLYNLTLSQDRSQWLAERCAPKTTMGTRVKVFGVGNEEPVSFENSKEGQAPNRRVEIYALAA